MDYIKFYCALRYFWLPDITDWNSLLFFRSWDALCFLVLLRLPTLAVVFFSLLVLDPPSMDGLARSIENTLRLVLAGLDTRDILRLFAVAYIAFAVSAAPNASDFICCYGLVRPMRQAGLYGFTTVTLLMTFFLEANVGAATDGCSLLNPAFVAIFFLLIMSATL